MVDFKTLKANKTNSLEKLQKELEKANPNKEKSYEDNRFWNLQKDDSGNGAAIIRFLPGLSDVPFVKVWRHSFQSVGGWYIENSLTTLGQPDPASEANSELWNSGIEENKKLASSRKRKLTYISNILVVKDPKNPENNGKVFLFKYGAKIFTKIGELIDPVEDGITAVKPQNPFCLFNGCNFLLKSKTVEGYPNYDSSSFEASTPVAESEAEQERIYNSQYRLEEFLEPTNFKSYDDLKARLDKVLGLRVNTSNNNQQKKSFNNNVSKPQVTVQTVEDDIESAVDEDSSESEGINDAELDYLTELANK